MKKVLFALPALAFTLLLAFCQKSETQETHIASNSGAGVTDRGCELTLTADNITSRFRVCGIDVNNQTACNTCTGTSNGVEQFQGVSGNFTLTNLPVTFSVTNTTTTAAWVTAIASGGNITKYVGPTGSALSCVEFTIDDQCVAH